MKKKVINLEINEIHYRLLQVNDSEYRRLGKHSIVIEEDYGFYMAFERFLAQYNTEKLNHAQLYVALKQLCGESGELFDHWKSSYAFLFLLGVIKKQQTFTYLLNIHNLNEEFYFSLRKIIDPQDNRYDNKGIYKPFKNEWSREEINEFIGRFYYYLVGFFESIKGTYNEFFFKKVDCCGLLFGYKDGQFFENSYDSEEEFEKVRYQLEKRQTVCYYKKLAKNILKSRFNPPSSICREIEQYLANIPDDIKLEKVLGAAIQCNTVTNFKTILNKYKI